MTTVLAAPRPRTLTGRDVALDLLRGLAMVVLVVNHLPVTSALNWVTEPFLSAAETLVLVSGVVAGMVFGRRWATWGPRRTTRALLHRAFVLWRASVAVVALVWLLTLVPGAATGAVTVRPGGGPDLYAGAGPLDVLTLGVAPWPFEILGFFIAVLALTPLVLWALDRGAWPVLLAVSWLLYTVGRGSTLHVLPAQSEVHFPLLVWQLLFVHGAVLGWHRDAVERRLRGTPGRVVAGAVIACAALAAYVRLRELGLSPFGRSPEWWRAWDAQHFSKALLDAARLGSMVAFAAFAYLVLRRFERPVARFAGPVLLPLGRCSFYVFIVHVGLCVAIASVPVLATGDGLGRAGNLLVQAASLGLLVVLVRRQVLFRWIPR